MVVVASDLGQGCEIERRAERRWRRARIEGERAEGLLPRDTSG